MITVELKSEEQLQLLQKAVSSYWEHDFKPHEEWTLQQVEDALDEAERRGHHG